MDLKEKYVRLHKQGFVPIFVNDNFDAVLLADACVEAVHKLPAVFVTGGVTPAKVPEYIGANAALVASGFDVIVKNQYQALQERPDTGAVVNALRSFLDAVRQARSQYTPELSARRNSSCEQYLDAIPHYHPY